MPYNTNIANMPIISDSSAVAIDLDDLDEPVISNDMPYAVAAPADVPASASQPVVVDEPIDAAVEVDVPMADYSGHEGMWAAAAAILDEIGESAPVTTFVSTPAPAPAAPAYVGRHSAVFPEDTARISREGIERAEAIAAGQMIKGFDAAVVDMQVGEKKTVHIPAADAYGEHNPEMVITFPAEQVPNIEQIEKGMKLFLSTPSGMPVPAVVIDVTPEAVTLDANHELAGKDLNFDIELVEVEG